MEPIRFSRSIVNHPETSQSKEWLVTNGIGGYASGTIANVLTRRYHGLLTAALRPPTRRTLLIAKLDEIASYGDQSVPLFANQWGDGSIDPRGFVYIESFHLEGTLPVWTFAIGDALLEKRIWMQQGENTTYVQYSLKRASAPMNLRTKVLVNYRDHHNTTAGHGWVMNVQPVNHGIRILPFSGATSFQVLCAEAACKPKHVWYFHFALSKEVYRGLGALDDHLLAAEFEVTLQLNHPITFILSSEDNLNLDGAKALADRRYYEQKLVALAPDIPAQLKLAADQFVIHRATENNPDGKSIIAGYHWFSDWGRDTMISLPGLTLATGRADIARTILRTYADYVSEGMLPNRFPDSGETLEYNTVDATLWYFEALHAYYVRTKDMDLLAEIFPVLEKIITHHRLGTRYQIHVDPADGLLYSGGEGVQLTWMDAKVGDRVITPRTGKAVEINALWYNALKIMALFSEVLKKEPASYEKMASKVKKSFDRFWYSEGNYLYDVIDTPDGPDHSLRPNQLFAVSLTHSPIPRFQQKIVVDVAATQLLTAHGLRSLAPSQQEYHGDYGGDMVHRDQSYHQGTVWGWLIGPFVIAHLKVYNDANLAATFLSPLLDQLTDFGVGSIGEIFDGDSPYHPRGCIAQAWSVAEVIRSCEAIGYYGQITYAQ